MIGLLGFSILRLFKRKDSNIKIGLSQSLNERELDMYRGNQPIGSIYNTPERPFTTVNYGINAYKNESRNPYETVPMHFNNPRLKNFAPQSQYAAQPAAVKTQVQTAPAVQSGVQKMTTPVNNAPVNQSNPNVDNLKFLESMTAIYEKSGRHDLAVGLKASLNKNNIK